MNPKFQRIEHLFHEALNRSRDDRERFLLESESDPEILAATRRLLASDADETLGDPVGERLVRVARAAPSRSIGPYRLLRELGTGGMGTVFLAERDVEGRTQQVALKLLRGFPTQASRKRMARERAMLAGLNHPNIARHIDGGESADGQPYLVMDYVESRPLPDYLSTQKPSVNERLKLYLRLCDAVRHAHQRLVLHRDIKPSNVIVRDDGTPVLIDFGVGTLLEEGEQPSHTITRAFTPGYSAPEQCRGEAETTVTDVFGLGALLFDLLTDQRLSEHCKNEAPVPAPSRIAADPARRRLLRGDLDRIVAKATQPEPDHRYGTVAELIDDVQRHLQGLPISAAPDRMLYRLDKWVRRHRTGVAAGSLIAIAAGLAVWQLNAERQRALTAEKLSEHEAINAKASRDFLASVLAETSPEAVRGQPITISTLLANAAEKLEADRTQDPRTRAVAWLTIGEVYADINDPRPALDAADRAGQSARAAGGGDRELEARILHARSAALIQLERAGEAREAMRRVIAIRQAQNAKPLVMARAYSDYGTAMLHGADFKNAERQQRLALQLLDASGESDAALRTEILLGLARSLYYQNDIDSAARELTRAETAGRELGARDGLLSYQLHRIAVLVRHAQHRYEDALSHAEQASRLAYRVYGMNSRLTADMELYLAMLLDDVGRSRAAVPHYQRSQEIARALDLDDAIQARDDVRLAMAYANVSDHARTVALIDAALPRMPRQPAYMPWLIKAHYTRGVSLAALGRYAQGRADFERALELSRGYRGEVFVGPAFVQLRHAQALVEAGRYEDAQAILPEAAPVERYRDLDPKALLALQSLRGAVALHRGDLPGAGQYLDRALAMAQKHYLAGTLPIAKAELAAAQAAAARGETAQARTLLERATPVLQQELTERAPELSELGKLERSLAGGYAGNTQQTLRR